jgi:ribonuclease VapC
VVLDTSAILAILFDEAEAERLEAAIADDAVRLISAATVLECAIVATSRFGDAGGRELDLMLHKATIEVVAVTSEQIEVARQAHRAFGKGSHRAGLNFGDCFSYALSRAAGEPLLFSGGDFARTDVERVVW